MEKHEIRMVAAAEQDLNQIVGNIPMCFTTRSRDVVTAFVSESHRFIEIIHWFFDFVSLSRLKMK